MNWVQTIVLAVLLIGAVLYLLFGAVFIVTALVERRPVNYLVPAEAGDPEWQKLGAVDAGRGSPEAHGSESKPQQAQGKPPYAVPRILAAARRGFTTPRLFKHQAGGIYKTYNALMVSPSAQFFAVVRWGTTGSLRNEATVLYTALDDGDYVVTSDRPSGGRVPGFDDNLVFLDADFDQLVSRHEERMRASGQKIRRLSAEDPLAEYNAFLAQGGVPDREWRRLLGGC